MVKVRENGLLPIHSLEVYGFHLGREQWERIEPAPLLAPIRPHFFLAVAVNEFGTRPANFVEIVRDGKLRFGPFKVEVSRATEEEENELRLWFGERLEAFGMDPRQLKLRRVLRTYNTLEKEPQNPAVEIVDEKPILFN